MDCATAREAISAALDGEDTGVAQEALDEHLASCADCTAWQHEAAVVTRLTRIDTAGERADVTAEVLERFVPRGRPSPVDWPRWLLGFAAVSQFSLVVSQLFLPQPLGDGSTVAPGSHMEHEAVAFNFAVGIALLWVLSRPGRAGSQLPVLLSFAGVLVALSIMDFARGDVGWYRLAGHGPLVLGVLCTALLAQRARRRPGPGSRVSPELPEKAGTWEPGQDEVSPGSATRRNRPPAARHVA
ncbi:zf-HC2 domain-containing protein [Amycolatopsis cynarae]|uniref:Zf-HC2 domain-containing protein n=1 Tax=Amycolatopsis cynarae TaxID=2995223 RepID=A0ABY7B739_9PSEU|nr:zf-HC2 domain-containing protein [Amycolatopsis sp. HUAS 11-8]WAL66691.1 zf-HC2 domain-containing protein [Amycolatopsis sp. HUAS 11-8]